VDIPAALRLRCEIRAKMIPEFRVNRATARAENGQRRQFSG
jgi:hypothetical protein